MLSTQAIGHFGEFGGQFVPETLMPALDELAQEFQVAQTDADFQNQLRAYRRAYSGRPTPLYYAERLTQFAGGASIYLKREDLNHTGSHKINNTLGQILLAIKMGKQRIIAETGAGQHGVATATVCARFGLECHVYMGEEDTRRQALNVFRMELLGAKVHPVSSGTRTLKDATNEAIRDWVTNIESTHYIIGSVVGPHPYPTMVRDFQAVIGHEAREQILKISGRLPDAIVACIGGGSNAMGIFHPFVEDANVALYGVEAAGDGIETSRHAAPLSVGGKGVLHGAKSYLLHDEDGQILPAHSISAGLDYPGVGPEHSHLKDSGRAQYVAITDQEALEAFVKLSQFEGITPALESAHAIAYGMKLAKRLGPEKNIVINISGRGDKDVAEAAAQLKKRGMKLT